MVRGENPRNPWLKTSFDISASTENIYPYSLLPKVPSLCRSKALNVRTHRDPQEQREQGWAAFTSGIHTQEPIPSCSPKQLQTPQNPRTAQAGRDLWRSPGPAPNEAEIRTGKWTENTKTPPDFSPAQQNGGKQILASLVDNRTHPSLPWFRNLLVSPGWWICSCGEQFPPPCNLQSLSEQLSPPN